MKISKKNIIVTITVAIIPLVGLTFFVMSDSSHSQYSTSDSNKQLKSKLETEQSKITAAIAKRYSFLTGDYELNRTILIGDGNYAAALIEYDGTFYRAVLKNDGSGWIVYDYPSIILSYLDFPDVPREVVKAANDLEALNDK